MKHRRFSTSVSSRRSKRANKPSFGDLCERSEGLAVKWREKGCTEREMLAFCDDDPFVLCDVIPALHALGFSENDVIRYVPHDGTLAIVALYLSRLATTKGIYGRGSGILALPPYVLLAFLRRALTRRIAEMKNKVTRSIHYEAEKLRRRAMAQERRRIIQRFTTSPCPTKEAVLEAWRHVRDSKETLVRFGSMMQDLECYVDNSLRFDDSGRIVGRNAGVKGWLRENLPELAEHYCSVIRYKAAAKKLRQIVGLTDPTPVASVLGDKAVDTKPGETETTGRRKKNEGEDLCNHVAEKSVSKGGRHVGKSTKDCKNEIVQKEKVDNGETADKSPPVEVVRVRAIYLEAMDGIPDVTARVMARIDQLCDPEQIDKARLLRGWREKYENAITVRRKVSWWQRLTA